MRRYTIKRVGLVLALLVVGLLAYPVFLLVENAMYHDRSMCQAQLASLWNKHAPLIMFHGPYREKGTFPSNMLSIADLLMQFRGGMKWNDSVGGSVLLCPGAQSTTQKTWKDVSEWSDYIYVYWPSGRDLTPRSFPLMYDRRLENHEGKGINIVTVGGKVFWDRKAKWLRRFARDHPHLNIPLPENIKRSGGERDRPNRPNESTSEDSRFEVNATNRTDQSMEP